MSTRTTLPHIRSLGSAGGPLCLGILTIGLLLSCGTEGDSSSPESIAELPRLCVGLDGIFVGGDRVVEVLCVSDSPSPGKPSLSAVARCPVGYHLGVERFDKDRNDANSSRIVPLLARLQEEVKARQELYETLRGSGAEDGSPRSPVPVVHLRVSPPVTIGLVAEVLLTVGRVGFRKSGGLSRFLINSNWAGLPVPGIPVNLRGTGCRHGRVQHENLVVDFYQDELRIRLVKIPRLLTMEVKSEPGNEPQREPGRILSLSDRGDPPAGQLSKVIAELRETSEGPWSSRVTFSVEEAIPWALIEEVACELGVLCVPSQECWAPEFLTEDGGFNDVIFVVR